ncbi:hypothetical protein HBI52_118360, partial [Parastagonospora nodorum]
MFYNWAYTGSAIDSYDTAHSDLKAPTSSQYAYTGSAIEIAKSYLEAPTSSIYLPLRTIEIWPDQKNPALAATAETGPDKKYYVHKALPVHHLGYFRRALRGAWREAHEGLRTTKRTGAATVEIGPDQKKYYVRKALRGAWREAHKGLHTTKRTGAATVEIGPDQKKYYVRKALRGAWREAHKGLHTTKRTGAATVEIGPDQKKYY